LSCQGCTGGGSIFELSINYSLLSVFTWIRSKPDLFRLLYFAFIYLFIIVWEFFWTGFLLFLFQFYLIVLITKISVSNYNKTFQNLSDPTKLYKGKVQEKKTWGIKGMKCRLKIYFKKLWQLHMLHHCSLHKKRFRSFKGLNI